MMFNIIPEKIGTILAMRELENDIIHTNGRTLSVSTKKPVLDKLYSRS